MYINYLTTLLKFFQVIVCDYSSVIVDLFPIVSYPNIMVLLLLYHYIWISDPLYLMNQKLVVWFGSRPMIWIGAYPWTICKHIHDIYLFIFWAYNFCFYLLAFLHAFLHLLKVSLLTFSPRSGSFRLLRFSKKAKWYSTRAPISFS